MQWRQKYKIPDHRLNRVFGHYEVGMAERARFPGYYRGVILTR